MPRRLSAVRGELDELLTSRAFDAVERDWLSVVYTDALRPDDAMDRLTARFPHVLVLAHEPAGSRPGGASYASRTRDRTDLEVGAAFVEHVRRTPLEPDERALLEQALEAGRLAAAAL